jgi:hypothetical protein
MYATLCDSASKASHNCILTGEHSYFQDWLTPIEPTCPTSLPSLYLTMPSRASASHTPQLVRDPEGAVEVSSCQVG